jgi:hypothetical protein
MCLAVGGVDIDDLVRAKVIAKKSGSVTLTEPRGRLRRDADSELPGVNRDRTSFAVVLDALHTALYVLDLDGSAAAKTWLKQRRLDTDARFRALVEGAVKAVPRVKEAGELSLVESELLERLVVAAFEDMSLPQETLVAGQLQIET